MRRREQHDAQARAIRRRSAAARRGWETRRARIEETLSAVEYIAERLRATAEGLRVWSRERTTASAAVPGVGSVLTTAIHPQHAANRLDKLAEQLSRSKRKKGGA